MENTVLINDYPLIVKIIINKLFLITFDFLTIFAHQKLFMWHSANLFNMIFIRRDVVS